MLAAPCPAGEFNYVMPRDGTHLVDKDRLNLSTESRQAIATELVSAAKLAAQNLANGVKTNEFLPSKCIALALSLDPESKSAVVSNFQLSRGVITPLPEEAPSLKDISADLARYAESCSVGTDKDSENRKLSGYLFELSSLIDPSNENAIFQMSEIQNSGFRPAWNFPDIKPAAAQISSQSKPVVMGSLPATRNRNTIKILLVSQSDSGQPIGLTNNLIGVLQDPQPGSNLTVQFSQSVGEQMTIATQEAARLAKVKHANLPALYRTTLSFEDKYTPKDGGSCGTAITVLLMSLIDNFDIDNNAVITGDITVDGQVQQVGGIFSKVEGALASKASYMVMPNQNTQDLEDYLVLHPLADLLKIQIFTADNIDEAIALMKSQKNDNLNAAMTQFRDLATSLLPQGNTVNPRNPDTIAKLQAILKLAPNHLSAKLLLRAAGGTLPKKMSVQNSVEQILISSWPMIGRVVGRSSGGGGGDVFETTAKCTQQLARLNGKIDASTSNLHNAVFNYVVATQSLATSTNPSTTQYNDQWVAEQQLITEINSLRYDKKFIESYLRPGNPNQ